ncbi:SMR family transporter [Methylocystis bryophila]|uniref:QacE family quaternary ammonium compound efflux SMR transporter n=1 Tax=Methylocystis bryophila TaxID=655015 RepID=A0A1W6N1Y0_9HYPH|nr:SMR family transporter [Methylocystis bryophila]ARN83825.1 QacE family quaternary ammonium compound efflux SMR transporter [Methylocystis bryophila]BDV39211.1 multidrug transporter [Methylocystis bryophila]
MPWLYLLIAVCAEVIGTSALKASAGMTKLAPSSIVVVGYGAAFYFLSLTLDQIPVGVAYAIWSGVGIVLISAIGWRFFDQTLDLPALMGMGLIMAGVAVINIFSKSAAH